jgi:ABC-type amino acid transport substrate-binding protein
MRTASWKSLFTIAISIFIIGGSLSAQAQSGAKDEIIVVGTEGAYPPYNFVEKDGTVNGYDADVIRALDARIAGVTFKFQPTAWDAIFVALESGKFDVIASQIAKNKAREAKYLFSDSPYLYGYGAIVFKKGRTDIKKISDLHGKTVVAGVGSYNTSWLENYNKANGNPIKIAYYDGNVALMFADIVNGRVDATLNDPVTTDDFIAKQNLALDYVIRADQDPSPVYLLFAKNANGARYKKLVDKALADIIADGTLAKLSIKWLGKDYTTPRTISSK